MAIEVGIKELRNLTSQQIRNMSADDEIVVTDRGVPIAALRPIAAPTEADSFLADLRRVRRGNSGATEELMADKASSIANQRG